MAVSWTKNWSASDDGNVFSGSDIQNIQNDIDTAVDLLIAEPSSVVQGDVIYYTGSAWQRLAAGTSGYFLQTKGSGANPAWAPGSDLLDIVTADNTTNASSTSEETVLSYTVPANTIGSDGVLIVRLWITTANSSGGNVVFTFRFKYGSTTIWTLAKSAMGTGNTHLNYFDIYLKGDGATNSQESDVIAEANAESADIGSVNTGWGSATGTSAEDSTGELALVFTCQSDTSHANISVIRTVATIEKKGAV